LVRVDRYVNRRFRCRCRLLSFECCDVCRICDFRRSLLFGLFVRYRVDRSGSTGRRSFAKLL
jgi:hypothetical protein